MLSSGWPEYRYQRVMETAIVYWVYMGIMAKKMENTILY